VGASILVRIAMPHYFFHTQIGDDLITDPTGFDLRDPDEAWERARATIRAALQTPRDQARLMTACLIVVDAAGDVVLEFPFSEAVTLPSPDDPTRH
jgi:hypothetical protein